MEEKKNSIFTGVYNYQNSIVKDKIQISVTSSIANG